MSKVDLRIDWATHDAAKYACQHWHYSDTLPVGKMVKVGAWENAKFIGVILFARGNTPHLGTAYGLAQTQVCELVRVALTKHISHVSKILAIAIKFLKKQNPDIKMIVSFADPHQGHHGGIYQAGNWIYAGKSPDSIEWLHNGKWKHNREITSGAFGGKRQINNYKTLPQRSKPGKHRYLMPLDAEMKGKVLPLSKPYPKRMKQANSGDQSESGGAAPTHALQSLQDAT